MRGNFISIFYSEENGGYIADIPISTPVRLLGATPEDAAGSGTRQSRLDRGESENWQAIPRHVIGQSSTKLVDRVVGTLAFSVDRRDTCDLSLLQLAPI